MSQTTPPAATFISGRNLGRIGTAMLLIGMVFLYRRGVTEGWITEVARIALGGLVSVALLGGGLAVSRRNATISALAEGAGVAGLFMTAFAAHHVYGLLTETAAFIQLVAVAALAFGLAIAQRRESMAVVGVIGALTAPLLIGGQLDVFLGDAGYLSVIVLTVGAILFTESWRVLFGVTSAGTALVGLMAAGELPIDRITATPTELVVLAGAAAVALFGGPIAAVYAGRHDPDDLLVRITSGTVTLAAFAGAVLAWGIDNDRIAWAIVAVGLAGVHAAVATTLPAQAGALRTIQLVPAVTFLVVAAGLAFEGNVLILVWAAQATGLIIAGQRDVTGVAKLVGGVGYGVLTLVATVALVEIDPAALVPNGDSLSILGVYLLAFPIAASLPSDTKDEQATRGVIQLYGYVAVLGWLYAELIRLDGGQGLVSAAWAIAGLGLVVAGWRRAPIRNVGIATLLVVVAKLFIVDLAAASAGWKIILFLGLGGTLLGLGYLLSGADDAPVAAPPVEPEPTTDPWPAPVGPDQDRENVSIGS